MDIVSDILDAADAIGAQLIAAGALQEEAKAEGWFHLEHIRDGRVIHTESFPNLVVNAGKNYALDGYLQTAVTIVGPYMGLMGATPTPAAGDTMASHAGWTEVGLANAPAYSGTRKTCAWSAAASGSKALSAALNFTFTSGGTVGGAFLVLSTGALTTIDNTAGTLYSAGALGTGNRVVLTGDQINISYTASL